MPQPFEFFHDEIPCPLPMSMQRRWFYAKVFEWPKEDDINMRSTWVHTSCYMKQEAGRTKKEGKKEKEKEKV